jgi:hypothetical protein
MEKFVVGKLYKYAPPKSASFQLIRTKVSAKFPKGRWTPTGAVEPGDVIVIVSQNKQQSMSFAVSKNSCGYVVETIRKFFVEVKDET